MAKVAYTGLTRFAADILIDAALADDPGAEIQEYKMVGDLWGVSIVTAPDTAAARLASMAAAIPAPTAMPATAATAKAVLPEPCLGTLSACFESNGQPDAIGYDKVGGYSYGCYQIAALPGTLGDFLAFLRQGYPRQYAVLAAAGGNEAGTAGTEGFKQAWRALATEPGFKDIEHEFIKSTHYDVFAAKLNRQLHLDLQAHTRQLRDVAWSVAVQHGPGNRVFDAALAQPGAPQQSDAAIIEAVYRERSNMQKYFPRSTPQVQGAILKRYATERAQALRGL